jgi:hypothetical protein
MTSSSYPQPHNPSAPPSTLLPFPEPFLTSLPLNDRTRIRTAAQTDYDRPCNRSGATVHPLAVNPHSRRHLRSNGSGGSLQRQRASSSYSRARRVRWKPLLRWVGGGFCGGRGEVGDAELDCEGARLGGGGPMRGSGIIRSGGRRL